MDPQDIGSTNQLIRQIGRRAEEMVSGDLNIEEKAAEDFVAKVDRNINAGLLEALRERFPDDDFISEEVPLNEGVEKYERIWLIDPLSLDGADNYFQRSRGSSVAMRCRMQVYFHCDSSVKEA